MNFKNYFSLQSDCYAVYRPNYPTELFDFINSKMSGNELAWDCATGNGQAAQQLAKFFTAVIATDASEHQIAAANPCPGVTYKVSQAECSGIKSKSVDLITVAQALHWFDFDAFYAEAKRTLKPTGLIAVWCYTLFSVTGKINDVLSFLYHSILQSYWPLEIRHIEQQYTKIPFPFTPIQTPHFEMCANWSCDQAIGFLATWSAVKRYTEQQQQNPLSLIEQSLRDAWGEQERKVIWPIHVQLGQHSS